MELVKSNNNEIAVLREKQLTVIESMPAVQKPFALALIDTRVLVLEKEEGVTSVYEILKLAELNSGLTKIDNKDLVALGFSTWELINADHKGLTIAEFKNACHYGVLGSFGEWFGICLKTVSQWIEGYLQQDERLRAIRSYSHLLAQTEIRTGTVPVIQKEMFSKVACVKAFERYFKTKKLPISPFAYYDIINELIGTPYKGKFEKTLVHDPEARKRILGECESKIESELMPEKRSAEWKGNLTEAEAIMGAIAGEGPHLQRKVKGELLKVFFDQLISEGKELEL